MAIVWAVRLPKDKDVSLAQKHGKLCEIFPHRMNPFDVKTQSATIKSEVLPISSEDDLILTVGPQIMVGTLVAMWTSHHKQIRFLVWNPSRKWYDTRWVGTE